MFVRVEPCNLFFIHRITYNLACYGCSWDFRKSTSINLSIIAVSWRLKQRKSLQPWQIILILMIIVDLKILLKTFWKSWQQDCKTIWKKYQQGYKSKKIISLVWTIKMIGLWLNLKGTRRGLTMVVEHRVEMLKEAIVILQPDNLRWISLTLMEMTWMVRSTNVISSLK